MAIDRTGNRTPNIRDIDYPPGFWREVQEAMHQSIIGLMGPLQEAQQYTLSEVLSQAQDVEWLGGRQGVGGVIAATQFRTESNNMPNYRITYSNASAYPGS